MDVLGQLLTGTGLRASWDPFDDRWYHPIGGVMTPAGLRVDEEGAQKLSAWYRGRDILATVLAMLPLPLYERLPHDGGAIVARDHPLYDVLHDKPNAAQDSFQWRRQKMYHLVDHGNAYDWIVSGARGFVDQLCPIEPTLVTPKQQVTTLPNGAVVAGRLLYDVRHPTTGLTKTFTQEEIFHLRGASDDGVVGKGILEYARTSLGTALSTESYAANIYARGTLNGGHIETPAVMDHEAARAMAKSFLTQVGEWHLPKVLEQGAKFVPNKMTPEDAQMLLSRKFSIDDMARWLGVSRMMLENNDPSFGNAEQFNQNLITYTMGGWLSLFEFAISDQLIVNPVRFFAQFTRDAIVRGDIAVRSNANVAYVNAGIRSVDEVRAQENWNKRGGKADELREPQNITGKPAVAASADGRKPPPPAPTRTKRDPEDEDDDDQAQAIITAAAARVLRKEVKAVQRCAVQHAADLDAFAVAVTDFYAAHVTVLEQTLQISPATARRYCAGQAAQIVNGSWLAALEHWKTADYAAGLATLALEAGA